MIHPPISVFLTLSLPPRSNGDKVSCPRELTVPLNYPPSLFHWEDENRRNWHELWSSHCPCPTPFLCQHSCLYLCPVTKGELSMPGQDQPLHLLGPSTPYWLLKDTAPGSPFSLVPSVFLFPNLTMTSFLPSKYTLSWPRFLFPRMAPALSSLQLNSWDSYLYLSSPNPLLPLSMPVRLSLLKLFLSRSPTSSFC